MKIKIAFIIGLVLSVSNLFSQSSVTLKKIYTTVKSYNLSFPVTIDSVNIKGDKFQNKDLLESFISFPQSSAFSEPITADLSGYFLLSKATSDARFYLLSFSLNVDKYAKTNIRITAPSMFEAYINGVKEGTKTSIEDTLNSSKTIKLNFPAQPGTYNIMIKYLSLASNESPEGVKVIIEPEEKDADVNYTFSSNEKRNITIKDILEGTRVTSSSISANGDYVLLTYTNTKNDGKTDTLKELYNQKNGRKIALPANKNFSWMPSSSKLYYTDNLEGSLKLLTIDPETMVENVLADNIPSGNFEFTPDEKTLIYTDKESPDATKSDLIILSAPEDRQPNNKDRYFLSKYVLSEGIKQRLTFGLESTRLNDISSDSRYILYSIVKNTPTVRPFFVTSMYKMDLETLQVETLWENEGFAGTASFSPDGKSILIEGSAEAFGGIGNTLKEGVIPNSYNQLAFIMDLSTKNVDAFTKDFSPSVTNSYWNSVDGMIYLQVIERDYERVYRYNPQQKQLKELNLSEDVIKSISFADKSLQAIYYGVGEANSTRAYILDLKNDHSVMISDPYKERLEQLKLGKVEDWSFRASDGTAIDGRYYLPPNFDSTKKYPLIVYYYGGTMPTQRTLEAPYPSHVYAALGYVVYVLQPSGSIGYGQEFAARHVNAWGNRTAEDIIEGTKKFVAEHLYIDGSKIGCIGASYGGFMTMYLQTQTDMFAAAISHAGISSISSYWGEGYWGYTYSSGASANSYPWNNKEMYVDQSPLFNADKIKTPLLLLHGTEDTNVPIGESIQMYTALKILGKPVEFIQVKGENHGIKDFERKVEWNYSIYAWFSKWLQNDPIWWNSLYSQSRQ